MTAIVLPPLPPMTHYGGTATVVSPEWLRARDLEVARVVLEAAGDAVKRHNSGMVYTAAMAGHVAAVKHDCLAAIRALEVKHHE